MADRHHHKKDRADATAARASQEAPAGEKTVAFDQLGLSREVLDAVAEMGHTQPTPVQAQAIPLVLAGRDVLAAAQTGTGKTEAFLLPTLSRLGHAGAGKGPLMLVITPTRELAQQIDDVARTICAHTGHRTVTLVGGVAYEPQYQALARGCDVLVATPGRLQDLLDSGHASLDRVDVLVLDEADRMLDMGFLPAVKKIVARTPSERQTLLFSATLDDDAVASTRSLVRDPAHVKIARKGTPAQTIEQFSLGVSPEAKHAVLAEVLRREGAERVIVFTRGKHRADAICRKLRKAGFACAPIHGNRTQRQRENALRSFREGAVDVLVATDVLARGIDIPDVRYVVNFDVPGDAEDYIHRIGRTGRAGESGWALTFVTEDDYLELRDAEALMGKVVPDYPRAGGIDLGAEPLRLDPARDPRQKLPGKKARKKMAEERAARREARRAAGEPAAKAHGAQATEPAAAAALAAESPAKPRRQRRGARVAQAKAANPRSSKPKAAKSARTPQKPRRRSTSHDEAMPYGPGGKPKRSVAKKLSRHPGDRGGRRG
ncbi:DEAD/DEAH box helicase [Parafannyhessea umbonata]|uniref:ATP-dependent RNA helicase RhlE n=1 Tax=Parafannyhessea umbonata TaxID=604330 RepID=A0A1G6KFV5_9ACTN|nr:DEAD/DEAH box helicase [Parafannyhessea umbonata]SDC29959.1 ATP-dependent RNA helicase RhlE [Parafannyhessea umbonata]